MLSEKEILLIIDSAMSKYAAENDGRKGLAMKDIVRAVEEYGGDDDDLRLARIEGVKCFLPDESIGLN